MTRLLRMSARIVIAALFFASSAAAVEFNEGGYYGRVSATHFGNSVTVDGRLDGGPQCTAVQITAQLVDNRGQMLGTTALVSNWSGSGSKMIQSPAYQVGTNKTGWEVSWARAVCIRP
jgi:hypothetical protein